MSCPQKSVGDVVEPEDTYASSKMETETFSFVWDVENFVGFQDHLISSPIFTGGAKCQHKWKVELLPKRDVDGVESVVASLQLVKSGNGEPVTADFQISLIDSSRKILQTRAVENKSFSAGQTRCCFKLIPRAEVLDLGKGFLVQGHILKIHCHISMLVGLRHRQWDKILNGDNIMTTLETNDRHIQIMKSFLTNGEFADFVFKTETSSYYVSRMVLAAHSPVFRAMFTSRMKESTENLIEIVDFSDEVVRTMLEFVHTGQCTLCPERALDLLRIAEKYELIALKNKCMKFIEKNLTVENAVETLIVAHLHSSLGLKTKIVSFVNRFKEQVQVTESFKLLKETQPEIFVDLYTALVS